MCEVTQEMPQSQSRAIHQNKVRWEQLMTKQTPRMKPQTHNQGKTLEYSEEKLLGLKPVLLARILTLNFNAISITNQTYVRSA